MKRLITRFFTFPHAAVVVLMISTTITCKASEEKGDLNQATQYVNSEITTNDIRNDEIALLTPHKQPLSAFDTKTVSETELQEISAPSLSSPETNAVVAAMADGVTTGIALSSGALEMNPAISTTPLGLVALTTGKILLVKYADNLPKEEKRLVIKTSSAAWGGAAFNNLMVLMAAPPPIPIIAGILVGFATWKYVENEYEQQDQALAARNMQRAPLDSPEHPSLVKVSEVSDRMNEGM
jgi:hypothetical protein